MDPYSIECGDGPQQVLIQDGIGRTGGILLGVIAGLALGIGIYGLIAHSRDYRELEREVRLQQLKLDEYRMALMSADIDPNPHLKGEAK